MTTPLDPTPASGYHSFNFTMKYFGLQVGSSYYLTITLGRDGRSRTGNYSPGIFAYVSGVQNYVISGTVCGFRNTAACPLQGRGGFTGLPISGKFIANSSDGTVKFSMVWYGSGDDPIFLDDVEITPV